MSKPFTDYDKPSFYNNLLWDYPTLNPAVKLKIETALEIVKKFQEKIESGNLPSNITSISRTTIRNPEYDLYYNSVETLKNYLDPQQPDGYIFQGNPLKEIDVTSQAEGAFCIHGVKPVVRCNSCYELFKKEHKGET